MALACLAPSAAMAQTSVADGVRALVLGDYESAAQRLRPLAEDPQEPNAIAQFFMAILYDSGQGVSFEPGQACALYLRAARPQNPFMKQSLALGRFIQEQSPNAARLCSLADDDRLPPPISFTLGPDHSVTVDRTGVTVAYKGTRTRTTMMMGDAKSVFLPIRHTGLTVSSPVSARRDFIEWFIWRPGETSDPAWTLGWVLFEVVGPNFLNRAAEDVLTVRGAQPPAVPDISTLVAVDVNASGEAEWVLSNGQDRRRRTIPFTTRP